MSDAKGARAHRSRALVSQWKKYIVSQQQRKFKIGENYVRYANTTGCQTRHQ
jgi:hypothetical protein